MKTLRIVALFLIAVAIGVVSVAFQTTNSRGQSQSPKAGKAEVVKPTISIAASRDTSTEKPLSLFSEAAARNAILQNELAWTFGGKQQHGWYLYDLLIGQTLNTNNQADSGDFAAALAGWQTRTRLTASGVLDEPALMALISEWQRNRLKDRTPATPDQLMTAPVSDFYDPERTAELRQVQPNTYAAYKQMVAAAIADPSLNLAHTSPTELAATEKYFKIVSAFRSREYQDQLRRQSPNAGSAGLAMNSPHFTGRALDLYVGGDPVDTKDSNRAIQVKTPAYQWLVRNAARFGFRPYFYEPWHWEYVQ